MVGKAAAVERLHRRRRWAGRPRCARRWLPVPPSFRRGRRYGPTRRPAAPEAARRSRAGHGCPRRKSSRPVRREPRPRAGRPSRRGCGRHRSSAHHPAHPAGPQHRQHRGDPDAPGDEQDGSVGGVGAERRVRPRQPDWVSRPEVGADEIRPARPHLALDGNAPRTARRRCRYPAGRPANNAAGTGRPSRRSESRHERRRERAAAARHGPAPR